MFSVSFFLSAVERDERARTTAACWWLMRWYNVKSALHTLTRTHMYAGQTYTTYIVHADGLIRTHTRHSFYRTLCERSIHCRQRVEQRVQGMKERMRKRKIENLHYRFVCKSFEVGRDFMRRFNCYTRWQFVQSNAIGIKHMELRSLYSIESVLLRMTCTNDCVGVSRFTFRSEMNLFVEATDIHFRIRAVAAWVVMVTITLQY